jgi:cell division protein FtsZ
MIEFASDLDELRPRITVIGVGGAGGNAVANMMAGDVTGVDFVVANTDAQALQASPASRVMQLGRKTTQGLGAGSRADLGRAAAEESIAEIDTMLEGVHMCFIAAGLGGGTGTGAAPVIAKAARDKGILTVGVVTKPFTFEGSRRARIAELGLVELQLHVDTLLVIPNQNLFRIAGPDTTFKAAFDLADEVLQQGVRGITDLMTMPGMINLDFADVRTIMANRGKAMMGSGEASGDDRAIRATEQAISNPLLDDALKGARGLIISITGGSDLRLMEVDEVAQHIKDMVDPDADIIWGSAFSADLEGRIRVSVVATGIDTVALPHAQAAPQFPLTPAQAAATRIAALRPIEAFAPQQPELGLARAGAEQPVGHEAIDDELLLTVERILTLVPPEGVGEFATLDPFAVEAATALQTPTMPIRGPSLFERMAMVARGKGRDVSEDAPPFGDFQRGAEWTNQRIARVA